MHKAVQTHAGSTPAIPNPTVSLLWWTPFQSFSWKTVLTAQHRQQSIGQCSIPDCPTLAVIERRAHEHQKTFITIPIEQLIPYENNPRHIEESIPATASSIEQCGNLAPIEIDENNIILSGHSRLEALKQLGYEQTEVIRYEGLTEEQKKKYRILANKTGEFSGWDFSKLEEELAGLDFGDFDFGFNTDDTAIDIDGLFADAPEKEPETPKQIQCPHCGEWFTPE